MEISSKSPTDLFSTLSAIPASSPDRRAPHPDHVACPKTCASSVSTMSLETLAVQNQCLTSVAVEQLVRGGDILPGYAGRNEELPAYSA
jgi:hypothetical protein